jgi:acyl-ACP thioesterase
VPFDEEELALWGPSANGRAIKARLRHPPPPDDAATAAWRFRATDLDLVAHVNNAVYWEPLEEQLLARDEEPASVDAEIEFRDPAQPGDALVRSAPGGLWITAADDGRVHASVMLATS